MKDDVVVKVNVAGEVRKGMSSYALTGKAFFNKFDLIILGKK